MEDQADKKPDQLSRRPEAARGHRPRPDQQARGPAPRRAAGRPRPQAPPAHAHRARPDPRPGRHHLPLRHPRPGRGHEPERPHRGDERRPHRADRDAGRDLRGAADQLRRRLHRRHQLPRGRRGRASASREYCRLAHRRACPTSSVFNDKQIADGNQVFLSVRPEKIQHLPRPARGEAPSATPCRPWSRT
ncbi:MAG: hypothetical protein MZU84_06310 [Sphingobacterium sp.]|nr:hypothetical protein [Sphingobacterium sp.]